MIVAYKTDMKALPENCMECTLPLCTLPINKDENFRAECRVVRHDKCPLIKVRALDKGDK